MNYNSSVEAIHRRVFELIAVNEDTDALLKEFLSHVSSGFSSATWISPAVDGILSMLENQCILTDSSLPVLSASMLGDQVKKIVKTNEDKSLLDENQRSLIGVIIEVCKQLLNQNNFNQKLFAKSINRDINLPIEVIWKLDSEAVMPLHMFVTSNLNRPAVIGGLAQSVSSLCMAREGEETDTVELRGRIVTDLLVCLFGLAYGADMADDVITKGLKKVSSALLDSITKKTMQLNVKRDVNFFELLLTRKQDVDKTTMKKYYARQLSVILSSNATFKVSDAVRQQISWTFSKMDDFVRSVYENILIVFETSEIIDIMGCLLDLNEINWKSLLLFVSVLLLCHSNAKKLFYDFLDDLLKEAMNSLNLDKIIAAMLLGRQGCLEGPHVFMIYQDWFQKMFGDPSSGLTGNRKAFSFLIKFLTDIVPHEPVNYLKTHIHKPPYIPPKCRHLWSDYCAIVKTRLIDLKEYTDEALTCGDALESTDIVNNNAQTESDIERAICAFEKTGKLSQSILEISIFKRSYFQGKFLSTLLHPRPIPTKPDAKMKFISALYRAKKISDAQYTAYEEQCREMTNRLLEGFFDSEEDEIFSVEEKLQKSLDAFQEAVLQSHSETTTVNLQHQLSSISDNLLLVVKQDKSEMIVECPQIIINVDKARLDQENLKAAQMILNCIGSTWLLKGSSSSDCGVTWLNSFLLMLLRHPAILQSICTIIFCLLTGDRKSLVSCHIAGLAAVLAHLALSRTYSKCLVYMTEERSRLPFLSHLFDLLPTSSCESLHFSLEISATFLQICCSVAVLQKENTNQVSHSDDILTLDASNDDVFKTSIFHKSVLHILLFAAPRIYCEMRNMSNGFTSQRKENTPDQLLNDLRKLFSFEPLQPYLQQNEMTFRDWARLEINILDADTMTLCERLAYYDWVVFVRCYPHASSDVDSSNADAYLDTCCSALVDVIIDSDLSKRLLQCKHHHHTEIQENFEIVGKAGTDLLPLVQKLVHVCSRNGKHTCHWLWKILRDRYGTDDPSHLEAKTLRENCVAAFCQILLWLPPSSMLSNYSAYLPGTTTVQSSVNELIWFVSEVGRNYLNDGMSLPPSLICHILEAFSCLQSMHNEEISSFLLECPLAASSAILNWDTVSHIKFKLNCDSILIPFFEELDAVISEAEATVDGKLSKIKSSRWTALALLLLIKKGKPISEILSRVDGKTKSALYNCLTIQFTSNAFHCSAEAGSLRETILVLYESSMEHIHVNSIEFNPQIELCFSDDVKALLPFVHVYMFNLAMQRQPMLTAHNNCYQNFNSVIANYNKAVEEYKSHSGEQWMLFDQPVVCTLFEALKGMMSFIKSTSVEQLKLLDPVVISSSDLQIQELYHKRILGC